MRNYDFLSIVIPTYNRPDKFGRLLRYLNKAGRKINVVILDSSDKDVRDCNQKKISALKGSKLKINYFEYSSEISPFKKYGEGVSKADTEYVMFCADDDIPFIPTLDNATNFLQEHSDYAAAQGFYINYCIDQQTKRKLIQHVVYASKSIEGDDCLERVGQFLENYEALFYAVHRRDVLERAFKLVENVQTTHWQELVLATSTVLQGKVKRLPEFYYARFSNESSYFTNWHPHEIFSRDPSLFFKDYLTYRDTLFRSFPEKFKTKHSRRTFDLAHLTYIHPFLEPGILKLIKNRSREVLGDEQLANSIREDQGNKLIERGKRSCVTSRKSFQFFGKLNYFKKFGKTIVANIPLLRVLARKVYHKSMPDLLKVSSNGEQFIFWREFLTFPLRGNECPTQLDLDFIAKHVEMY